MRVHPSDKKCTPYTYDGFMKFNNGDRKKTDQMWQESKQAEPQDRRWESEVPVSSSQGAASSQDLPQQAAAASLQLPPPAQLPRTMDLRIHDPLYNNPVGSPVLAPDIGHSDPMAELSRLTQLNRYPSTINDWTQVQDIVWAGHRRLPAAFIRVWSRSKSSAYFVNTNNHLDTYMTMETIPGFAG